MIRLAVAGASGRMGQTILRLASQDAAFKITGALEHASHPALGKDIGFLMGGSPIGVTLVSDSTRALDKADVLIDFTHPTATEKNLKAVLKKKAAYVLGTTGLSQRSLRSLRLAAQTIPIVQSPNMSIGVNVLFKLAEISGKALDEHYDIEIAETHHRMKKDAPSGTALKLVEILAKVRGLHLKKDVIFARQGEVGARPKGKIGVVALRGGDVIGDHVLSFLGDGERIELIHRASSRDSFAQGALQAAKFLARQKCGLYNMLQVLGIAGAA